MITPIATRLTRGQDLKLELQKLGDSAQYLSGLCRVMCRMCFSTQYSSG